MFKHILHLPDIPFTQFKGDVTMVSPSKTFIQYNVKNANEFKSLLDKHLSIGTPPDLINFTEILSPGAGPHIDGFQTALNYYVTADQQDQTMFWRVPDKDIVLESVSPKFESFFNQRNNLIHLETHTASKGDWILINTHVIHSVNVTSTTPRLILRLIWNTRSFETIQNTIEPRH